MIWMKDDRTGGIKGKGGRILGERFREKHREEQ